jgi:hypothetical protein
LPTRSDVVTIPAGRVVCLDTTTAEAGILYVYGELRNPRSGSVTLTMYGNLVVDAGGLVDFAQGSSWLVQFIVASETQFIGGALAPIPSDTGWWVTGAGRVNLQGASKQSWTRATLPLLAGATTVTVENAFGWRVGDELAITPTTAPTVAGFEDQYDTVTITALAGNVVTFAPALRFAHPGVTLQRVTDGIRTTATYYPEVLNLTRTGRIEGRPGLRTHFWVRTTTPQVHTIRYVQFRHLGPQRFDTAGNLVGVLGRWGGPHFHMCGENCSGSLLEGNVVRNFGNHAYIPHDSNGITFRLNIAHDGFGTAFWYDGGCRPGGPCEPEVGPNRTLWERNVTSRLDFIPRFRPNRLAGFLIARGFDGPYDQATNRAIGNVAVGILAGGDTSGYHWPDGFPGVWQFEHNLAHNNRGGGIFAWQNDQRDHRVRNFVAYHNGQGIEHGAYANFYIYEHISLHGNLTNILLHALSNACNPACPERRLVFRHVYSDSAGRPDGLRTANHNLALGPAAVEDSTFVGHTRAAFAFFSTFNREIMRLTRVINGSYWLASTIGASSLIEDFDSRLCIRRFDQPGIPAPSWNASVTAMPCQ